MTPRVTLVGPSAQILITGDSKLGQAVRKVDRVKCRFCCVREDFIDAHIIPAGFWRPFREDGITPRLVSSSDHPKRIPTGVYDKAILCAGCEPQFGPWDQYALELLEEEPPGAEVKRIGSQIVGYEFLD